MAQLGPSWTLDWVPGPTGSDLETELGSGEDWVQLGHWVGSMAKWVCDQTESDLETELDLVTDWFALSWT